MVYGARKQSMARMETDYSKHTHFRLKIKWRLEHLGALGIMDESAPIWVCVEMNPFILFSEQKKRVKRLPLSYISFAHFSAKKTGFEIKSVRVYGRQLAIDTLSDLVNPTKPCSDTLTRAFPVFFFYEPPTLDQTDAWQKLRLPGLNLPHL